jgi:hypothetical protein
MCENDMEACLKVAKKLNEVIIFRSTGPWSMRWIKLNYPTKNFHVKGKSSDWGPQAGFVPRLGMYSKVGGNTEKEVAGDKYNADGLKDQYTSQTQLTLTLQELQIQASEKAAGRLAIEEMISDPHSKDYFLFAYRSGDGKKFGFRAVKDGMNDSYKIFVYANAITPQQLIYGSKPARPDEPQPLMVMTSSEIGADNRPLTGDYDLMAVCPTWGNLNSRSVAVITKEGIDFGRAGGREEGQSFPAGANLDGVLDMRTNTGLPGKQVQKKDKLTGRPLFDKFGKPEMEWQTYGKAGFGAGGYNKAADATPEFTREHNDMGNLTPRILRCVNALNTAMGQTGALRRVHHNAESHRNVIFGGITAVDMGKGEAFPLTAFHPENEKLGTYSGNVLTLLNMAEFQNYAKTLHEAGYFVPKSWVWGMSIRDLGGYKTA